MRFLPCSFALAAAAAITAPSAGAADLAASTPSVPAAEAVQAYPSLRGEVAASLQNDWTFDSDDPDEEINDLYPTIEGSFDLLFTRSFFIHSDLVFEPVLDPDPGEDRAFGDLGLYVDTLYAQYDLERFSFLAGKIHPTFGIAWDAAPGLYGTDLNEEYELTERIGGAIAYRFGGADAGEHVLTANLFFADTSPLSDSLFTRRGRVGVDDGGASNTESLRSFSLTLDGGEFAALPGLVYHLGLRRQEAGQGDAEDETGVVAGLTYELALTEQSSLQFVGETVYLDNAYASADDSLYFTAGLSYLRGPWWVGGSYTRRNTDLGGGGSDNADLFTLAAGYEFDNGIALDAAYKLMDTGGISSHTVGVAITKALAINTGAN